MSFASDIADDLLTMDGVKQVTLIRRSGTSQSLQALRRKISNRELAISNGHYKSSDARFHVRCSEFESSGSPTPGDSILDNDGETWTILSVEKATLDTRYALHCRNLAITEQLDTLLSVEVATYTKDEFGQQVATWSTLVGMESIRGKVQQVSGQEEIDNGRRRQSELFRIYFAVQWDANERHRVVDSEGNKYKVIATHNVDDISQLFSVDASIDRTGV